MSDDETGKYENLSKATRTLVEALLTMELSGFPARTLAVWSVGIEGVPRARSAWWMANCFAHTRRGAMNRAAKLAGEPWSKCRIVGMRAMKVIVIAAP